MKTTKINIYKNNTNQNEFLEVRNDGHHHNSIRQYTKENGTVQIVSRKLKRIGSSYLKELLQDYSLCMSL